MCALKCLNVFLVPKSKKSKAGEATAKKGGSSYVSVPFLLMEAPVSSLMYFVFILYSGNLLFVSEDILTPCI